MASIKNAKNLLNSRDTYNRYFGDFRGVDFSSDHTQVKDTRLAYAVNMWKDYNSGMGETLETIPGFRQKMRTPYVGSDRNTRIYGIHSFKAKNADGAEKTYVFVHSGEQLFFYASYPKDTDVVEDMELVIPPTTENFGGIPVYVIPIPFGIEAIVHIYTRNGDDIAQTAEIRQNEHEFWEIVLTSNAVTEGDTVYLFYFKNISHDLWETFFGINEAKSMSFVMNNRLYIVDGKNFIVFDTENYFFESVSAKAYIPTTYINIRPNAENGNAGTEYEQRNMLSPYFKNTFIGDGATFDYYLNEKDIEEVTAITVNGLEMDLELDVDITISEGKITFHGEAPPAPAVEGTANVEITAKKTLKRIQGMSEDTDLAEVITHCTVAAIYDDRLFLTGNPELPNHVFYCERNSTGYADPTYFGILNYVQDGVGNTLNTAMLVVADTLMVLKSDTQQDGSVYYHTPLAANNGVQPKVYPGTRGLAGTGCIGAAINFLDDPVFISRYGLEADSLQPQGCSA